MTDGSLTELRRKVIDNPNLSAWEVPRALSDVPAGFLSQLYADEIHGDSGIALVALGGYGRSELSPSSDLDLMLVHNERDDIDALADRIWYPLWDEGFKLRHSVRSLDQTLR